MQLQLLKLETQSKSPEFTQALDKMDRNLGEKKYLLRDRYGVSTLFLYHMNKKELYLIQI